MNTTQTNKIISDIQQKIEAFAKQYFSEAYIRKENTQEQGRKLRYAVYMKSGRFIAGLSQDTFDAHEPLVNFIMSSIKKEYQERTERESWVVKALTGNIITKVTHGEDYDLYALTAELPKEVWAQVKHLTQYIKSDEDMDGGCDFGGENYKGWTITFGADKLLKEIAEKVATPAQRERAKKIIEDKKENRERGKQKQQTLDTLVAVFIGAEYPEGQFKLEGESIEDPFYPADIYGGGRWFVIQHDCIWFVKNNGHDGDDWGRNNVQTGGAGAVGVRIKYNAEIAEKIRTLVK